MNYEELKKEISSAYEDITPDKLDAIKEACKNETQDDCILDFTDYSERKRYKKYYQVAGMVASLVLVSLLSMVIGRKTAPVVEVETTSVSTEQIAGYNPTVLKAQEIEIEVGPDIKVLVNEDMSISEVVATDPQVQEEIDSLDIVGDEASIGIEKIHQLLQSILKPDADSIPQSTATPTTEPQQEEPTAQPTQAPSQPQSSAPTTGNIKQDIRNANDLVEGSVKDALDIVDDTIDTTTNIVSDVGNSVFNIFDHILP